MCVIPQLKRKNEKLKIPLDFQSSWSLISNIQHDNFCDSLILVLFKSHFILSGSLGMLFNLPVLKLCKDALSVQ